MGTIKTILIWFLAVSLFWSVEPVTADIYVFTESDGTIRFTNRAPPKGVKAKVFSAKSSRFSVYGSWKGLGRYGWKEGRIFKDKFNRFIKEAATRYGLDTNLLKAVIHVESAFNPRAVSPKGALGLMQLMPATARRWGVRHPFSPEHNIHGGAKHLAMLIRRFSGNLAHVLAAYNAGEEAVDRFGGIPPYQETRDYVKRVLLMKNRYSRS